MNSRWTMTQDSWDRLLAWLGPGPEEAAQKYETIRRRLTIFFSCRGSSAPEDLTDEAIDRVARAISRPDFQYVGDPALFFYGVAKNILLESFRRPKTTEVQDQPEAPQHREEVEEEDREHDCLERCLARLPDESRALILDYYKMEKSAKIDFRKDLAGRLGMGVNALRIQVYRLRVRLRACVQACLHTAEAV